MREAQPDMPAERVALTPTDEAREPAGLEIVPDIRHLITEDDTPVDNLPSEKQQRLLTEPLYSSWAGPGEHRAFLAAANIGVFSTGEETAIVPDVFLSLDVTVALDWWRREHRSYFVWEFGKPPDVVVEIVSNDVGHEDVEKFEKYARLGVLIYVIYDPRLEIMPEVLTVYRLGAQGYERQTAARFADFNLGVTLWEGEFEGKTDSWLRWTDARGVLIPTGKERAEQERARAEQARRHAEQARRRAERERARAEQADQRAAQEHLRAEQEHLRAEQADHRAEQEREHAEQADSRAAQEHLRAEQADQRAQRLAALLRQAGIDPEQP